MSAPLGHKIDTLVGLFYTSERSPVTQIWNPIDAVTGVTPAPYDLSAWGYFPYSYSYAEIAAYADVTYRFTDKFDVQVGGRGGHIKQSDSGVSEGGYCGAYGATSPCFPIQQSSTANPFTYLLTPRYKISSNLMVYARAASGYRAGGPNTSPPGSGIPLEYQPDKTEDYEIGVKGETPGHALSVDASAYYINWKNMQDEILDFQFDQNYISNAGTAKSEGVQLSSTWNPVAGLKISAWATWSEAVLTSSPAASLVGKTLPGSSRWSGRLSVEDGFPLATTLRGFVGGSASFVGDRLLSYNAPLLMAPSYVLLNLNAGATYKTWKINFYANNVADRRAMIGGGPFPYYFPPYSTYYIQPRTVGMSVAKNF